MRIISYIMVFDHVVWGVKLNKHRINTTISAKHWEILKKHTENFETQQKVLEAALERIENGSERNCPLKRVCPFPQKGHDGIREALKSTCIIHKDLLKAFIEVSDLERLRELISSYKPLEHLIALYYLKPLQKCSLKEILDGLVFFIITGNVTDSINYIYEGNQHILRIVHSLNYKFSEMLKFILEDVFEAYGVKTETEISEKSLFMKIYRNL
jgi:hypothetical protein